MTLFGYFTRRSAKTAETAPAQITAPVLGTTITSNQFLAGLSRTEWFKKLDPAPKLIFFIGVQDRLRDEATELESVLGSYGDMSVIYPDNKSAGKFDGPELVQNSHAAATGLSADQIATAVTAIRPDFHGHFDNRLLGFGGGLPLNI